MKQAVLLLHMAFCLGLTRLGAHAQLSSLPKPITVSQTAGASAGGDSYSPLFSANGRFVVFTSSANNLVTNDSNAPWSDIFVHDLTNRTTRLVTVSHSGLSGANGNSFSSVISSNGQFIAFQSDASNLTTNDSNGATDIFVRDMNSGTTSLVSVTPDGSASGNGRSSNPQITPDGRWVAFESFARNLSPNDLNVLKDVFMRDLQSGTTHLVSVGAHPVSTPSSPGQSESPSISADGQRIAFASDAEFSVPLPYSSGEVYVRDLASSTTFWASSNVYTWKGSTNGRSFAPALSEDGRIVAFKTESAFDVTPAWVNLYCHDLQTATTTLISSNVNEISFPQISPDGRFIAYETADNVYLWDRNTQSNILVSIDLTGTTAANGTSSRPILSADATRIVFLSNASNLVTNGGNGKVQLYWRDLANHQTQLVSARTNGAPGADLTAFRPDLSPDGTLVTFDSADHFLVANDLNQSSDVFLRDITRSETSLISARNSSLPSRTSPGRSILPPGALSADGRFALFSALDRPTTSGDYNEGVNLLVRDLAAGTTTPVAPSSPTNIFLRHPVLSANGHSVAYERLSQADNPTNFQIFLGDLQKQTNALISKRWQDGLPASGYSANPSISGDGRWIAYQSDAMDLTSFGAKTRTNVFVHDVSSGTNILVSVNWLDNGSGNDYSVNPIISRDGRWVAFQSRATDLSFYSPYGYLHLFVRDLVSNSTRWISFDSTALCCVEASDPVFDPTSRFVFFTVPPNEIHLHDLQADTNELICNSCFNPTPGAGGRWLVYESILGANGIKDIVRRDLLTGTTNLISVSFTGSGGGDASSFKPVISYDGRYVVFASRASNLVPNDTNGCTDMFVRDTVQQTTILVTVSPQTGAAGNGFSSGPVLGADGRTVLFQSYASDLTTNDYNNNVDLFYLRLDAGDSDQDGMADDWELAFFGTLARDGSGDFDGDGQTDLQEFKAGTDPTNLGSVLRVLTLTSSNGETRLFWSSIPGKTYRVQVTTELTNPQWDDLSGLVTATGSTASATDISSAAAPKKFYRVLLVP